LLCFIGFLLLNQVKEMSGPEIRRAVYKYFFGDLDSRLLFGGMVAGAGVIATAVTYGNARFLGVKNPKGIVVGVAGFVCTMPIISLATEVAQRSIRFSNTVAIGLQVGVGILSVKKFSEWAQQPLTYKEIVASAMLTTAEVAAVGAALFYR
jgi:hypothetical protein